MRDRCRGNGLDRTAVVTVTVINTLADLETGLAALAVLDPRMGLLADEVGVPPLRRTPPGFAALAQIVVGQQISRHAAQAIWGRLEAAGLTAQAPMAAADPDTLGQLGLSRPKQRCLLAVARSSIDFAGLERMEDRAVHAQLTALHGIGPWTAEVYLLSALGRPDAFPAGDIALQEAAKAWLSLPLRPTAKELEVLAQAWRPWRAVAARLLWAYYARIKGREGGIT